MGLRGPLAAIKLIPADKLVDLSAPDWLDYEGRKHWDRHADYLSRNNLLTQSTKDCFAMCCDLWSEYLQEQKAPFKVSLAKQYTMIAKQFRMLPTDKGGVAETRHVDKEEFSF